MEAGVFKEYTYVSSKCYGALRSTRTKPVQPFASLDDYFYGAFKLGGGDPDENKLDSSVMMLTNSYVVLLDAQLTPFWMIETSDLMLPTREHPNPTLQGSTMYIHLADGGEVKELVFVEEAKAIAALALFEDVFFMLVGRDAN